MSTKHPRFNNQAIGRWAEPHFDAIRDIMGDICSVRTKVDELAVVVGGEIGIDLLDLAAELSAWHTSIKDLLISPAPEVIAQHRRHIQDGWSREEERVRRVVKRAGRLVVKQITVDDVCDSVCEAVHESHTGEE